MAAFLVGRDSGDEHHGVSGAGIFFIILAILIVAGVIGWIVTIHLRAQRLGLPRPTLASYIPGYHPAGSRGYSSAPSGGVLDWVNDRWHAITSRRDRTAGGAYEEPLSGARGRRSNRGISALDPDEAWDTHVGAEADGYGPGGYYEEQELGLHPGGTGAYAGGGYAGQTPGTSAILRAEGPGYDDEERPRGRSRSREPAPFGAESSHEGGGKAGHDPFGDHAERSDMSLRGVSPRPMDAEVAHAPAKEDDSPTERKSIFREGNLE
ncbi:MAG: hypothetical protein M1838_000613 [Thelocarpon superellum]|nr:MAG: hypothetical protein M1838_000613 [Thelocarpon superellum]